MGKKIQSAFVLNVVISFCLFASLSANGATNTATTSGTWETTTNWSLGHVPLASEDVIINSGVDLSINSAAVCNSLTVGNTTNTNTTLTLSSGSLAVTGFVNLNPSNLSDNFSIAVATQTMTVGGNITFPTNSSSTSYISVTSGSVTVTGTGTVAAGGKVAITGGGTITFNGLVALNGGLITNTGTAGTYDFAGGLNISNGGTFTSKAAEVIELGGTLTCSAAGGVTFATKSTQVFIASTTVTPTTAITFGNVTINATGIVITLAGGIAVDGNWTNNGSAACMAGAFDVTFTGTKKTIGGTSGTTFSQGLIIANASTITLNAGTSSASTLTISSGNKTSYLTQVTGAILNVTSAVINQSTASNAHSWFVNSGQATVSGTLSFPGTLTTTSHIAKAIITTGSLSATTLSFAVNTTLADQFINVTGTGTVTITNALTFTYGEILNTGGGTITFNGLVTQNGGTLTNNTTAGIYNFGAGLNISSGVFTSMAGETIDFGSNFTCSLAGGLTLNSASTEIFTGNSTVTPTTAITFGALTVNSSKTLTLAGSITVDGNWTDNGTFTPGTNTVTLNAAGTTQTVTATGTETYYNLTATNSGGIIQLNSNIMVTNQLNMGSPDFNLNGNTLTLGNNTLANLVYTTGVLYGGTFKRWWPSSIAITSNSSSKYGFFPIGPASGIYDTVRFNSTTPATTSGYVSVSHTSSLTVTTVAYTDNEVTAIQGISNESSTVTTSGLAGGAYTISVAYDGFASPGTAALTDYRLETYTGGVMGSAGATVTNAGSIASPVLGRSGLSVAQIAQVFVAGTKSSANTPIQNQYFSIANGAWSTSGTWSTSSGGASCACTPVATGYVVIENNYTVTLTAAATANYLTVQTGGSLSGASSLTVNDNLSVTGTGHIAPTGTVTVTGTTTLSGTGASTLGGTTTLTGVSNIGNGTSLTVNSGATLNLGGNVTVNGTLSVGTGTTNMTTTGAILDGSGNINGTGTFQASNNITVASTASLTIAPTFNIANNTTVTQSGTITLTGNLTGGNNNSTWALQSGALLNAAAGTLSAKGTLDPSTCNCSNTVNYNGAGAQTITSPGGSANDYSTLTCSNAGTKTLSGNIVVNNALNITGSAILNEGTNNISDNGAATLNMSGTYPELMLQRSAAGTYPELSGLFTLSSGAVYINQTAHTSTISSNEEAANGYYDLYLTGSVSYDLSGGGGGITIQDNLYVQNSSAVSSILGALSVGNALSYSSTGSTTMDDDLATGTFTQSAGTLNDGGNNIYITGSGAGWANNGGTFTATGTITFEGTAAQTIGGTAGTSFATMTVSNASGLTLSEPVTITSSFAWGAGGGVVTSTTSAPLIINNGVGCDVGSSGSYVDGVIEKLGNDDPFTFPLGNGGHWVDLTISGLVNFLATSEFTCQYFNAAAPNNTAPFMDVGINHVSKMEYWNLSRVTANNEHCYVTLNFQSSSYSGITSSSDLTVAHFATSTTDKWEPMGSTLSGTIPASGSTTSTSIFTTFSPITFGSISGTNPLPIQLISFTAECNNYSAELKWITATETNNDHFIVERTQDGIHYETVAVVKGAGNSTTERDYSAIDQDPLPGTSYYRLSQTDLDGNTTYLNTIVYVPCENENSVRSFTANNMVKVQINTVNNNENYTIVLFNSVGQKMYERSVTTAEGLNTYSINSQDYNKGIYIIQITGNKTVYAHKLVLGL